MWAGITAVVGLAFLVQYVEHFAYWGFKGFYFRAFIVALITGGFIITFKDKKPKDD